MIELGGGQIYIWGSMILVYFQQLPPITSNVTPGVQRERVSYTILTVLFTNGQLNVCGSFEVGRVIQLYAMSTVCEVHCFDTFSDNNDDSYDTSSLAE